MIGDGVELGYLAPYLGQNNVSESDIAVLFTVYGVTVAIGSWCAGALSNIWGPRRVMWIGVAIWAVAGAGGMRRPAGAAVREGCDRFETAGPGRRKAADFADGQYFHHVEGTEDLAGRRGAHD